MGPFATYSDFVPATATSAALPASARVHAFALPRSLARSGDVPTIPDTSDVRAATSYVDGLGRNVQTRERLGGSTLGDPAARVVRNLGGYRVVEAVLLDAALRRADFVSLHVPLVLPGTSLLCCPSR